MKKLNLIIAALSIIAISTLFVACEKESTTTTDENQVENIDNTDVNKVLPAGELSTEAPNPNLDGCMMHDEATYKSLPKATKELADAIAKTATTRASVYNLYMPPVMNQGSEGSCTAFACGYEAFSFALWKWKGMPYLSMGGAYRSPENLYNWTKISDCASGAFISTVLNRIKNAGLPSYTQQFYYSTNGCSQLYPTGYNAAMQATYQKASAWGTVPISTANIKAYLNASFPVIIGVKVDDMFNLQTNSSAYGYTWMFPGGVVKGGHAMVIVGYDDNRQAFKVQNSWGTGYHQQGYLYIPYSKTTTHVKEAYFVY